MSEQKWVEIARTGTFTDSAGRPQTFTEADLCAIANAYDPKKRDCPLVFGHPKTDAAPAYGWMEKIKSENGKLFAQFAQVPEQVKEIVAKGHYRHVSMSLMPDRVTLRHVALLGAAQPAIDGLKALELRRGDEFINVDFATENKEQTMPEDLQHRIGQLEEQLKTLKAENATLKQQAQANGEGKTKAEAEKREAEAKAEKAASEFAAYRQKIEDEKRQSRVSELVRQGKVKPNEKAAILAFAAQLAKQPEATMDFTAPDGAKETISLEEHYMRELEARPVDGRFMDFSVPPAHAMNERDQASFNPDELARKL